MGIQKIVQTSKMKEIYFFFTHDTSAPFSSSPKTFFCEISHCAEKSSKSMLAVRWDENRLRSFCLQPSHSEVLNSVCAYFRSLGKSRTRKFRDVWSREVKNVQFRVTLNFSEIKSLREWSSWSLILLRKTFSQKLIYTITNFVKEILKEFGEIPCFCPIFKSRKLAQNKEFVQIP